MQVTYEIVVRGQHRSTSKNGSSDNSNVSGVHSHLGVGESHSVSTSSLGTPPPPVPPPLPQESASQHASPQGSCSKSWRSVF